jgi:endonuclease/exonuclease/phosphatase family metal-dependent hydrolase
MARLVLGSRVFFRTAALAATCLGLLAPAALADEVVRIMAANTSSGNNQSYDPGHGNRIFQGLDPDIALVQEMNVTLNGSKNSAATYRQWVNENFGTSFHYHVETGKSIPNGIVSRYPFLASGVWEDDEMPDREFVWARIDLPGDMNLLAVSVHLSSGGGSSVRNAQATDLRALIQANKLATDHVVIGGDFNTDSRSESCLTTLSTVVRTASPWPADQNGVGGTNASRAKPYDWVAPGSALAALSTPLVVGSSSFANGLVFDSRVYDPLSAVSPVQEDDSGATNMQHMAVMRAFLIPTNDPPVIAQGPSVSVTLSANNHPTAFSCSLSATDPEGDPLTWSIQAQASHGTAGIVAPAGGNSVNLSYQPTTNYTGSDSFIARVSDGKGGTDTVSVQVTVQAVSALDAWTYTAFQPLSPATQAAVWGEAADPDQDGYANLEEFAHGLDPEAPDAAPSLLSCSLGEDRHPILTFKMRMDGNQPALAYTLHASTDPSDDGSPLLPEDYTVLNDTDLGNGFTRRRIRIATPPTLSRRFFQLTYERPAGP